MDSTTKLAQIKALLGITDSSQDAILGVYLSFSQNEILSWLYSGDTPTNVTDVPVRYESVQIMSVIVGYNTNGIEGQSGHNENSISRQMVFPTIVEFIHTHIQPYAKCV